MKTSVPVIGPSTSLAPPVAGPMPPVTQTLAVGDKSGHAIRDSHAHGCARWLMRATKFAPITIVAILLCSAVLSPRLGANTTISGSTAPRIDGAGSSATPATVATHALSIRISGGGAGSVTSHPLGIDCHDHCSASFTANTAGTTILLTAIAHGDGSIFTGWAGACRGTAPSCTVTTDASTSVEAVFADIGAAVQSISIGYFHSCAVSVAGAVWCWGNNAFGQIGDGTTSSRRIPTAVSGLASGVRSVVGGYFHTCAVTTAGAVLCWGYNANGQIGDGTTTNRPLPTAVAGLSSGVQAITTGHNHSCALTTAGVMSCWGFNTYGQLGDGTVTNRSTPVAVAGLPAGIQSIDASGNHSCAATGAGALLCWGWNLYGQLGDGTNTSRRTPLVVTGLSSGVLAFSAGHQHTCAVTSAGAASCWGDNPFGQLGDGTLTQRLTPVPVSGLASGVQTIRAGGWHTCALTATGAMWCWGQNTDGQLGDGTTTNRSVATPLPTLTSGVKTISAGGRHSCASTTSGAGWCWGYNFYGQVGDGTVVNSATPVLVIALPDLIFRHGFE